MIIILFQQTVLPHSTNLGNKCCTQRSTVTISKETILKISSNIIRSSQSHTFFYKVKYHAGIAGNECADALAKYQACHSNDSPPAETTIRTAGPGCSLFFDTT